MEASDGSGRVQSAEVYGETFHSRFLAVALRASLEGDRSLFEGFWTLAAPQGWETPQNADVQTEQPAGGQRRIDLCVCDVDRGRLLGVEIKTRSASARPEQLQEYASGLEDENPKLEIAIAYLTPFNRKRAGEAAERLPTVKLFDAFTAISSRAGQHVSWLEVADLPWDGSDLWRQYQGHVRNTIAPDCKLNVVRNRTFEDFFGEDATQEFWEALAELQVHSGPDGAEIRLEDFRADLQGFARALAQAFEILIVGGIGVSQRPKKDDDFAEALRERFLHSRWHTVHAELFGLAARFPNVWIQGRNDYGVRVAHEVHASSGVSLVRSVDPDVLKIGAPR